MTEVLTCFTKEVPADIYVMTHTTAPFISKESIQKGLESVVSGKYDSSFAAKKNYRISCGWKENHLIIHWIISLELRIYNQYMRKLVVSIFTHMM